MQEAIVAQHQISRSELLHRIKFAEKYPDRTEVSTIVDTYRTWLDIHQKALYEPRAKKAAASHDPKVVPPTRLAAKQLRSDLALRRGRLTDTERAELRRLLELLVELLGDERKAVK
jgi:hypothetical protein